MLQTNLLRHCEYANILSRHLQVDVTTMNYNLLSSNQKKVFDAILANSDNAGYTTISIRQIKLATGIKSLRGVTLQLEALERFDLIRRVPNSRGVWVNQSLLQPNEKIQIPIMLSPIAAGYGNQADDFSESEIEVSLSDTKGVKNAFAVKVSGESMINAGINDGDIAIISPHPTANDGDIVAASYPEGVTLKRFRIVDSIPMLIPANPKYDPIVGNFIIQGKLINLVKNG